MKVVDRHEATGHGRREPHDRSVYKVHSALRPILPDMRGGRTRQMVVLALVAPQLYAQRVEVTRYDLDQGLPQSMVNHVVQDSLGFIWFGTGDGLARFDGTRFIEFKHDVLDTTTLGNNAIWGIVPIANGDLLVGTGEGLDRYDARSGRFLHVRTGVVPDGSWRPVHAEARRTLFYSPLSSTFLWVEAEGTRSIPSGHRPSYALRAVEAGSNMRYHSRPDTLIDHDLASGAMSVQRIPALDGSTVSDLLILPEGTIILADKGAWLWNAAGQCLPLPGGIGDRLRQGEGVKHVERAPDGRLWFSMSGAGVFVVDDQWEIVAFHPLLPMGERPLHITSIAFDRQGNTWVGTDGKGVFRISPQRIKFGRVMPGANAGWSPSSFFTKAFAQWDSTHVLVSFHQGGAALFNEGSGRLEPLDLSRLIGKPLPDNTIGQVLNDGQGHVWLKMGPEMIVVDPKTTRVVDRMEVITGAVLVADPHGGILLVQFPDIHEGVIEDARIILEARPYPDFQRHMGELKNIPQHLALDRTGQLWSSFLNDGLKAWAPDGARPMGRGWEALTGVVFNLGGIIPLADGHVLITTDRGLLHMDPATRDLDQLLTRHDGLPDDHVYGVVVDPTGAWWISTNKGLCRMQGDSTRTYSTADGLQSKEFNGKAWFRSASGRIYFGGVNGFNHFMPAEVRNDDDLPLVRLIGLRMGQDQLPLPPGAHGTVQLPYPRNTLHIELAVLEFSAPERNMYKWRSPGYHDMWTTATASAPIELSNVPGGDFTLEVIGMNGDGTESGVYELLRIAVVRPFWAGNWFIALVATLLIALVAGLWAWSYRRRMQRKLQRAEQEMKELRMRTRLAKDIHDDVGSGLARMAALSRAPKRNTDSEARFEKVSDISGELLGNLRDVVWMNDPRHGTLDALLIRLRVYASDLFEDTGATVVCDFPDPVPARGIHGSCVRNLFLIAKEALHNARKYSGAMRIGLRWREDGDSFTFEISDDGGGITSGIPQGSGHGTTNMRQRAEEMNASYERTLTPGGGTTVRVHGRSSCLDE